MVRRSSRGLIYGSNRAERLGLVHVCILPLADAESTHATPRLNVSIR